MSASATELRAPLGAEPQTRRVAPPGALGAAVVGTGSALVVGAGAALGPVPGVAALAGVAFGLLVLRRPAIGGIALCGVLPLLPGLQRGVPIPQARLSELMIFGLAALILIPAGRRDAVRWRAFDWAAFAYVALTAVVLLYHVVRRDESLASPLTIGFIIGPLQYFLLYRAVLTALRTEVDRRRALIAILVSGTAVALLTIVEFLGVGPLPDLLRGMRDAADIDPNLRLLRRASGPYPGPHATSGFLAIVTLLCVALLLDRGPRPAGLLLPAAVAGIAVTGAAATVTGTPLLAAVIGALAMGFWVRRLTVVVATLGVALLVAGILFAPTLLARVGEQFAQSPIGPAADRPAFVPQTLAFRYEIWTEQYFPALAGDWLLGQGVGPPEGVVWPFAESLYVSIAARGGIVLLAAYGALMWALAHAALRAVREGDAVGRPVGRALLVAVTALALMHSVDEYFLNVGVPHLLWALAALAMHPPARDRAGGP